MLHSFLLLAGFDILPELQNNISSAPCLVSVEEALIIAASMMNEAKHAFCSCHLCLKCKFQE